MSDTSTLLIGANPDAQERLDLGLANRHGLITGATGTGKTVTLQILAEGFAEAGVPVFCADVKGDLSGISVAGEPKDFIAKRAETIGMGEMVFEATPTIFWDLFGEQGHPIRTTISEMGPLVLSRLLDLTEAQEGALNIAFRIADDEGLLLLDLKDLRALLADLAERGSSITTEYGNVSRQSVGAILRDLLVLENQGGEAFFGEPALDIRDFMRIDRDGRGFVSVLAADKLMQSPRLYATFLLWLLSELFEDLPEVGDLDRPRLVFFFDEAHLLFDDAPKALIDKVEQVVRLVRSKGVGVYFVTQNPLDIPETVLAQLGNRVQHALRAYTPREQKAVRTAADTFRPNPDFKTADVITELGVGEALVSTLSGKGVPSVVQRTLIRPPFSRIGPATARERASVMEQSPVRGLYDRLEDRDSAYEILERRALQKADEEARLAREQELLKEQRSSRATGRDSLLDDLFGGTSRRSSSRSRRTTSPVDRAVQIASREIADRVGKHIGQALSRGILGSILRG
ncbi:MAG: helicase HerA-like domain-containing protein [Pseudomonadota bacterium]